MPSYWLLAGIGSFPAAGCAYSGKVADTDFIVQQVQGLKAVSVGNSSLKLTWSKLEYASSYEIFQAMSQEGTYEQIGSAEGTTFIQNGLTYGKKYYYKIRAGREAEGET